MQIFHCVFIYFDSQGNGNQFLIFKYPYSRYSSVTYARMVECTYLYSGWINFRLVKFLQAIICKLATPACFMLYKIFFNVMSVSPYSLFCSKIDEVASEDTL